MFIFEEYGGFKNFCCKKAHLSGAMPPYIELWTWSLGSEVIKLF